jgi:hypothetical protein
MTVQIVSQKGKRTPQHVGQYGTTPSNSCSPKASKKTTMGLLGSPIASPSPSPTLNTQQMMQQVSLKFEKVFKSQIFTAIPF